MKFVMKMIPTRFFEWTILKISDCRLPIADFAHGMLEPIIHRLKSQAFISQQSAIGNWQSAIA